MRRLVLASALGFAMIAAAGFSGTASAMPFGAPAPAAAAPSETSLLTLVHNYRHPYGHYHRRPHHVHRRHYVPPPRHHWRPHHHHWRPHHHGRR